MNKASVKEIESAELFAQYLRELMILDGEDLSLWNINIDKIIEHGNEILKLNPSDYDGFMFFMHDKDIITPTEEMEKEIDKVFTDIKNMII